MQKDKRMILSTNDSKESFKSEICQAMINASACFAFVAMQENNDITHRELKYLDIICDNLDNIWDYVKFCIDNDINIDISDYSYNLVRLLSDVDVEDYKSYYIDYGDYSILASI